MEPPEGEEVMPEDREAAAERKAFAERVKTGKVSPEGGSVPQGSGPDESVLQERVTWKRPKPRGGK
jgi:hypothetical protein